MVDTEPQAYCWPAQNYDGEAQRPEQSQILPSLLFIRIWRGAFKVLTQWHSVVCILCQQHSKSRWVKRLLTITLWALPEIRVLHIAKVDCFAPPCPIILHQALQPHVCVKRVSLLGLAVILRTVATKRVVLPDRYIDKIAWTYIARSRECIPFVDIGSTVLVEMVCDLKGWNRSTVIEVRNIWLLIQAFLRHVAIVCGFHPVSDTNQHHTFDDSSLEKSYGSSITTCPSMVQHVNVTSVFSGKYATTSHPSAGQIRHSVL
jgi:hypothetical protein